MGRFQRLSGEGAPAPGTTSYVRRDSFSPSPLIRVWTTTTKSGPLPNLAHYQVWTVSRILLTVSIGCIKIL